MSHGEIFPHDWLICEKFLLMRNVKKIYHIAKVLHIINVEQHVLCGEMWRNLSCRDWRNVFTWQISPHEQWEMWSKSVLWRNFSTWQCLIAIYAVLSRNLFCRDLRAFVWRNIEPKIVLVEKKRQISGMLTTDVMSDQFKPSKKLMITFAWSDWCWSWGRSWRGWGGGWARPDLMIACHIATLKFDSSTVSLFGNRETAILYKPDLSKDTLTGITKNHIIINKNCHKKYKNNCSLNSP